MKDGHVCLGIGSTRSALRRLPRTKAPLFSKSQTSRSGGWAPSLACLLLHKAHLIYFLLCICRQLSVVYTGMLEQASDCSFNGSRSDKSMAEDVLGRGKRNAAIPLVLSSRTIRIMNEEVPRRRLLTDRG